MYMSREREVLLVCVIYILRCRLNHRYGLYDMQGSGCSSIQLGEEKHQEQQKVSPAQLWPQRLQSVRPEIRSVYNAKQERVIWWEELVPGDCVLYF
jgi:hypothetical protein